MAGSERTARNVWIEIVRMAIANTTREASAKVKGRKGTLNTKSFSHARVAKYPAGQAIRFESRTHLTKSSARRD